MTNRPWLAAIALLLGAAALIYNVRIYSALWMDPKQTPEDANAALGSEEMADAQVMKATLGPMAPGAISALLAELPPTQRNPFSFASGVQIPVETGGAALVLQGTLVGPRRVAWINQRACSEGDEIDGHVVERIEVDHVVVRRGPQELELWPGTP